MATHNDITGDPLISKPTTDSYRSNWDMIFNKKKSFQEVPVDLVEDVLACFSQEVALDLVSKFQGLLGDDPAKKVFADFNRQVQEGQSTSLFDGETKTLILKFDQEQYEDILATAKLGRMTVQTFLEMLANVHFLVSVIG